MKKPLQTRILKWAAGILLIVYLAAMAWGVCWNTTLFFPMETQLSRLTGYDEVELLLSDGGSHIFRTENNMLCFTQVTRDRFLWIPMPYTIRVRAEFNLETKTVDYEEAWFRNGSAYPNEYAQEARRLYSYQIYGGVTKGAPTYDFYMGVSETEPTYALLEQAASDGDTIRGLQYAEVDGLYVFMFDEVFGDGSAAGGLTPSPYGRVNTLEDVWVEVKEGTVSPTGVTLVFYNDTEDWGYTRGVWYALEQSRNGQWYQVDPIADYGQFHARGISITPTKDVEENRAEHDEFSYDWTADYGELPQGEYRIVVDGYTEGDTWQSKHYLTAEFQIP